MRAGGELEVVGGLTANGTSSAAILLVNPATGTTQPAGRLAIGSHDAAGATVAGRSYLFGGGDSGSIAAVQRLRRNKRAIRVASLPSPRSDLAAATVDDAIYLLGGYDGHTLATSVLKSTDGTHFTGTASLPVPVRYPAVAVQGGVIWIFGGQGVTGPTDVIQGVDVSAGQASVAGHLPSRLSAAAAVVLGGQIFVCGGTTADGPTDAIRRFDPSTGRTRLVGHLPTPLSNSASAVIVNTGYLLGGETPAATSSVVLLQLMPMPDPRRTP